MTLVIENLRYGENGIFGGILAYPGRAERPLPAVVVIHEAFGIDDHIEDVTRRVALAGYAAFAPDVYARDGRRPEALSRERGAELRALVDEVPPGKLMDAAVREAVLATKPAEVAARLRASVGAMFAAISASEANLVPLVAATRFLRAELDVTRGRKVASVGFCMGGALSARLAAADPELAGAAVFYGLSPPDEAVAAIRCPVLGLYGALDARINQTVPAFAAAMEKHGLRFERHVYPDAHHAFFNDTRASYQVRAARDAWVRTLSFLHDVLA